MPITDIGMIFFNQIRDHLNHVGNMDRRFGLRCRRQAIQRRQIFIIYTGIFFGDVRNRHACFRRSFDNPIVDIRYITRIYHSILAVNMA